MNKSESIQNLSKALLQFHGECPKIEKGSTNPFFKSRYSSVEDIQNTIKGPLQNSGIVYVQMPEGENGLTTCIIHAPTGEYIESTYKMTPAKNDPQGVGSAITYQKRYALAAALGLILTDEDDDGNSASNVINNDFENKQKRLYLAKMTINKTKSELDQWTKTIVPKDVLSLIASEVESYKNTLK